MSRTMEGLRVGVAGAGSLGYHHVRILRDLPGVQLAGFHEPRDERAAYVARELGVEAFSSLESLLDRVDALVVAVPTVHHREVAVAALERGIHVMIEKPLASTLEEADAILEAARKGGAIVQTGHVERFNAAILGAEAYLERPLFIESHRLAPFVNRGTDVAVVLDLMIHDVDLVQSLVKRPVTSFEAAGMPVLTPSIDIANARLQFEGGAVANLTASRVSMERMRKLRIFQPSGYLSLNLADGTGEFLRLKGDLPALLGKGLPLDAPEGIWDIVERIPLAGTPVEPLRRELECFRDAALGHMEPVVSGEDGRNALAIALAIEDRIENHVIDTRPT
jgi:predicted dehydrogenase